MPRELASKRREVTQAMWTCAKKQQNNTLQNGEYNVLWCKCKYVQASLIP